MRVPGARRVAAPLELPALLVVLAGAAAVRLYALDTQPGGLYPDEAAEALDAHRLLTVPGYHPVFFTGDAGREALYGYMVAVAFRVAGESVTVLRATSAVLGTLAVLVTYLWLRREGRAVALGASAWLAGALWLVCISRDGMRNITVPVAGAAAMWGMSAWSARPSRARAMVAGAVMGVGLWTYQPLKLLPFLLLAWLLWLRRRNPDLWSRLRRDLGWLALAYLVVGAPMLFTAVTEPALYFGRAAGVTPAGQHTTAASLAAHTVRTLLMFIAGGDPNQRHNVDGLPLMGVPLAALALLGGVAAWRNRQEPLPALVLASIPVFLVPPLVGTEGDAPHFLRSLGLAAPLAVLVGWGCAEFIALARQHVPSGAAAATAGALLALGLAGLAGGSAAAYFGRPDGRRYEAYSFNVVQLAAAPSRPGDAVVVDDYRALDVWFLDRARLPLVLPPAPAADVQMASAGRFFGLDRGDLARVIGRRRADAAVPVAWDTQGHPSVWRYEGP